MRSRKVIIYFVLIFGIFSCEKTENIIEPQSVLNNFANGSFEIGFYGWDVGKSTNNLFSLTTKDPFDGKYCAEIYLDSTCRRAELSRINCAEVGTVMKYKWAYKFDKNYIDSDLTQTIHQFHDYPDFYNGESWETMTVYPPPVFTTFRNDTVFVRIHTIDSGYKTLGIIEVNKNEWISIEYIIKWSLSNDGYVLAKINNEYITPFNGIDHKYFMPTVYNNMGNFFKVGLYRSPSIQDENKVYVNNLEIFRLK